ncbi:putative protein kinase [Aspergillus mulundensis]|uniref:Protein kinase domain-containing protein n=1 Tax=Aspergillus mulundensis TaxID=1810919 RepID=A0A3D8REG1_9EURO|nr:hypothetical protein DSM5745_07542 [Aspergillus mulundensis]RDW72370.1 hypothetical protein DSM5745_07542 [Aspergillus mulundensis]
MPGPLHRGPGLLEVKLGWAYRLDLPDECEQWRLYAITSYEGTQESTEALAISSEKKSVSWIAWHQPFRFEVSASPSRDLTISVFARALCEGSENQVISLGLITLDPFSLASEMQKLDIQNGTGKMEVQVLYTQKEPSSLEAREVWDILGENSAGLICVEKKDTGRSYGMETIDVRSTAVDTETLQATIEHPFIAPLKFVFRADPQLKLLSPLSSGGYLFDHLQRERIFDVSKARFYAAELVCILEFLHGRNIVLGSLEAENILLDVVGHISLCKPSLYSLKLSSAGGDEDCICPGTSQYPPPETILDDKVSRAGDWWALGIILSEMLMGLPPFYHKNDTDRRRKVLHQELQLPESMPSTARDILAGLLHKDPARRLGGNGVSEIKAHPFFEDVNWDGCVPANHATPFKPHGITVHLRGELQPKQPSRASNNEFRVKEGEVYEQLGSDDWPLWIPRGQVIDKNGPVSIETRENEEWELVQDPADEEFYFWNRLTGERVLACHESFTQALTGQALPSIRKQAALAAALQAGYKQQVFSHLLRYGVDLNVHILDHDETINKTTPDGIEYKPDILNIIPVTPLEWAVEHKRIDLATLFLDNGADPNYTVARRHGPALIKAVKQRAQDLIEILVHRTDRVSCTRALGRAVETGDLTSATTLLAHGALCDFKEGDRPAPPHPWYHDYDSLLYRTLEAPDLTPPLVRAARTGNARVVELLLSHGADVNAAYHDLGGLENETDTRDSAIPASFPCGRVVYLAMEMGHIEVVRLLVDAGADIDLEHCFWRVLGHTCVPAPRSVYLGVRAGLEAAVVERTAIVRMT